MRFIMRFTTRFTTENTELNGDTEMVRGQKSEGLSFRSLKNRSHTGCHAEFDAVNAFMKRAKGRIHNNEIH